MYAVYLRFATIRPIPKTADEGRDFPMDRKEADAAVTTLEGEIQKLEDQISVLRSRIDIINQIPADFVQGDHAERLREAAAIAAGEDE